MEYLKTLGVVVGTGVFTTLLLMTWVHVEVRLSSVKYSVALVTGRDLGKSKMAVVSSDLPGGGAIISVDESALAQAKEGDIVCVGLRRFWAGSVTAEFADKKNCKGG
jgi:hypothetical protein